MGFLSGTMTFERFRVIGGGVRHFGPEQVEVLEQFAIGQTAAAGEPAQVGFLAGDHLFDLHFSPEKNVLNDALHFGMRIDTDQIPAAVRRAWLQLELAVLTADNPSGRPTKAQRQEAKEAVEARCEEEAKTGKFRRMQQIPLLWDGRHRVLYFGSSSATAIEQGIALLGRAFEVELERITASKLALAWAEDAKKAAALDALEPAVFLHEAVQNEISWWNGHSGNFDYLGNEFLLWLWWYWETQSDVIQLPDDSEVTGMFARTLSLECPRAESGKESISAESPVSLPEALLAIQSGKLPRKAGLTLVRQGEQYDLSLQAESFAVGGAKIRAQDDEAGRAMAEDRVDSIRNLSETLDLLFQAFCGRRVGKVWSQDLEQMRGWLSAKPGAARKPAA